VTFSLVACDLDARQWGVVVASRFLAVGAVVPWAQAEVGAVATHAWIEVLVPGMTWVAIDPTNRQWINERYVAVSFGRDFRDATPLRGTFKGSGGQILKVRVIMKRRTEKPERARAATPAPATVS